MAPVQPHFRFLPASGIPTCASPPPVLLAAESTVFGEFLVDRYGPTFLQAMGDALLEGLPTGRALATLPATGEDEPALEQSWADWLGHR